MFFERHSVSTTPRRSSETVAIAGMKARFALVLRRSTVLPVLLSVLPLLVSCGSEAPSGSEWLLSTGGDTVTIREAGQAWWGLQHGERQSFLDSDSPMACFVLSMGRNRLVTLECDRLGIPDSPVTAARARARNRAVRASHAMELRTALIVERMADSEVLAWIELSGRSFLASPIDSGPSVRLRLHRLSEAELRELAVAGEGDTVSLSRGMMRIDSVLPVTSPETAPAAEEPSLTACRRLIAARRAADMLRNDLALAGYDSVLEQCRPLLEMMSRGELRASDTVIVLREDRGYPAHWTVGELMQVSGTPAAVSRAAGTGSTVRLEEIVRRLLCDHYLSSWLGEQMPQESDSIDELLRGSLMMISADSLYRLCVSDSVSITGHDLQVFYDTMQQPVMIPEKRVFELALIPDESALAGFRRALADGRASSFLNGFPGPGGAYAASPGSRTSPPLLYEQTPSGLSDALFSLEPSDTSSWVDPCEINDGEGFLTARLVLVIPAHEASLEEAASRIIPRVRSARETERFTEWMVELEERYGLSINERVLSELPPDPGRWTELPVD